MNRLTIRYATEGDAALIADMGARMFKDAFAADNHPEDMAQYINKSFTPVVIAAELREPDSIFLLAYKNDTPIGYARLLGGKLSKWVTGPKPVELVRIYVDQHAIGTGYGSALMKFCLTEARHSGYETIWLGVWEKNGRAIRFYRKWGFVEVGSQEFVLGNDVQRDLVMARPVNTSP